jgi:hypothetical protein
VIGGTQRPLFWLSVLLLVICLGTEVSLLVLGLPVGTSELVVGRVLGLLDAIAMTVLAYWFGTSSSSALKTDFLAAGIQQKQLHRCHSDLLVVVWNPDELQRLLTSVTTMLSLKS